MNLLREYIRELLTESMKTIDDLPDGVKIEVTEHGYRTDFALSSSYEEERLHKPYGTISIEEQDDVGNCGGAWGIAMVAADQGWGPLLYDIAMEWATMNAGGLIADRSEVSGEARRVWNYYLNNRSDVTAHQLDDRRNTLAIGVEDNCDQQISRDFYDDDWHESALSKRYTKPPTTIEALKAAGKWDNR